METKKVKRAWYRIVANGLLTRFNACHESYLIVMEECETLSSALAIALSGRDEAEAKNRELLQRQTTENLDGAVAVQVIRERMRDQELPAHLEQARSRGMRQRNMDLVRENRYLRSLLNKLDKSWK